MVGCRITFGLRPHVIRHPTIDIFPYYVNKQGITNSIMCFDVLQRARKREAVLIDVANSLVSCFVFFFFFFFFFVVVVFLGFLFVFRFVLF